MTEILPWLVGPAIVAVALFFIVRSVIGAQKKRAAVLQDLALRRRWQVDDRPSRWRNPAVLTLVPPEGGWRIATTCAKSQSGGGRRAGWTTFHSETPALSSGRLVLLPAMAGAGATTPAAAMAMMGGVPAAFLLRQFFGKDMGADLGSLEPLPGDYGGITLMASPGTTPPRDPLGLACALSDLTEPAGAVIDADGLRLRMAMADEDALESLADQGVTLSRAMAAAL